MLISPNEPKLLAPRAHLAIFLAIQFWVAIRGGSYLHRLAAISDPDEFHFRLSCYYIYVILLELALVGFVWFGIRKTQTSLKQLIGGQWMSVWAVVKDLLIAFGFWLLWMIGAAVVMRLLGVSHRASTDVYAMLPS